MSIDPSVERQLGRLRIWNLVVALILAAQAVLIAALVPKRRLTYGY
jgi:hypothetical protein